MKTSVSLENSFLASLTGLLTGPIFMLLVCACNGAVYRPAFFGSLAQVEAGNKSQAVGKAGERGLYQLTRSVWYEYTSQPFALAHDPATALAVATQHADLIERELIRRGITPTAYLTALCWNAGVSGALSGRAGARSRDYARRVSNLYLDALFGHKRGES